MPGEKLQYAIMPRQRFHEAVRTAAVRDEVEDAASASKKMEEKWKMEEDDAAPTWKVEWKMESEG
jgi:hypothetical protein